MHGSARAWVCEGMGVKMHVCAGAWVCGCIGAIDDLWIHITHGGQKPNDRIKGSFKTPIG